MNQAPRRFRRWISFIAWVALAACSQEAPHRQQQRQRQPSGRTSRCTAHPNECACGWYECECGRILRATALCNRIHWRRGRHECERSAPTSTASASTHDASSATASSGQILGITAFRNRIHSLGVERDDYRPHSHRSPILHR